jgi:NitT/TauT family transport system permease protein
MSDRALRFLGPAIVGVLFLAAWEAVVRHFEVPWYVLPGPALVAETLWRDGPSLLGSLWVTVRITLAALAAAIVLGGAIAILFAQSRVLEQSFLPYAIALQVTPVVAIAPLIIIWVNNAYWSVLILALIVAFFPIVANTTLGLNSADRNLAALFKLYGATRWQTLRYLRMPTA